MRSENVVFSRTLYVPLNWLDKRRNR